MKGLRVYQKTYKKNWESVMSCFFTNWIQKNKVEAVVNISTLIPATNIIQHLMFFNQVCAKPRNNTILIFLYVLVNP